MPSSCTIRTWLGLGTAGDLGAVADADVDLGKDSTLLLANGENDLLAPIS